MITVRIHLDQQTQHGGLRVVASLVALSKLHHLIEKVQEWAKIDDQKVTFDVRPLLESSPAFSGRCLPA